MWNFNHSYIDTYLCLQVLTLEYREVINILHVLQYDSGADGGSVSTER